MPLVSFSLRQKQLKICHLLLLNIYILSNIVASVVSFTTGELGGDFAGFNTPSFLAILTIILGIVASFILVMIVSFNFFSRMTRTEITSFESEPPRLILSLFVLIIQSAYLIYSVYYNAGIAGLISKNESLAKYFFYVLSADFLFLFYFASSSSSKFVIFNTMIFVVSNVLRGWASWYLYLGWLIVIKIVWKRRVSFKMIAISAVAGIALMPIVLFLKIFFRLSAAGVDYSEILSILGLEYVDLLDIYSDSFMQLFQRLQHFSSIAVIWNNLEIFRDQLSSGVVKIFFLEGFIGLFLNHFFSVSGVNELNTIVISILQNTDMLESGSATHIGIIGWMIVAYEYIPFYLCYLIFLMLLSHVLVKYSRSKEVSELNWLIWLLLLMHGWFGALTNFLVTGFIYFFLANSLRRIAK